MSFTLTLPGSNKAENTASTFIDMVTDRLTGSNNTSNTNDNYKIYAQVGFIVSGILAAGVLFALGHGIYRLATHAHPSSMSPITYGVSLAGITWLGWEVVSLLFRISKIYNTETNYTKLRDDGFSYTVVKTAAKYSPLFYLGTLIAGRCGCK